MARTRDNSKNRKLLLPEGRRAKAAVSLSPRSQGHQEKAGTATCLLGSWRRSRCPLSQRMERRNTLASPFLLPCCFSVNASHFWQQPEFSKRVWECIFLCIQTRAEKDEEWMILRANQANEWHSPIFLLLSSILTLYPYLTAMEQ